MGGFAHRVVSLLNAPSAGATRSPAAGPIESLNMLRKSLLFAELSNIAYLGRAEAGHRAFEMGFPEIRFYDRDGA
jgi:hypothetical protein